MNNLVKLSAESWLTVDQCQLYQNQGTLFSITTILTPFILSTKKINHLTRKNLKLSTKYER